MAGRTRWPVSSSIWYKDVMGSGSICSFVEVRGRKHTIVIKRGVVLRSSDMDSQVTA